ncbi:MAG TPA: hypothetical protein VKG44_01600 [Candidatus Baltobacteraceae bacterium]|nr:hypothetical protein [Candidatus Baltobacteraceae bacterium]
MLGTRRVAACIFFGLSALVAAGCGGGGYNSGGTPAGPTPTPSPGPSITVNTRPLDNGDSFTYAGTTATSFVFQGASPSPAASSIATVAQDVNVTAPSTFNGVSGVSDFTTRETDTTPLQVTTVTTDTYYQSLALSPGSNLVDYGYNSSDSFGETLKVYYGALDAPVPLIVDELPETSGAIWTNTAAETLDETAPGNQTSTRTVNDDGSYTDTTTYPSGSTPPPLVTATIVENSDGSGSYALPVFGPPNSTLTFGAPSGGSISIVVSQPGQADQTFSVTVWYPLPLQLYSETDTNKGSQSIPAGCNTAAKFGTRANAIEQDINRVDTVLGTTEALIQTQYVVPSFGVACVTLSDTLLNYYDYSGQSASVITFSGTPLETTTITTTLGLSAATVASAAARVRSPSASAAYRIANAKANFIATVERYKLARERALLTHLHKALKTRVAR